MLESLFLALLLSPSEKHNVESGLCASSLEQAI